MKKRVQAVEVVKPHHVRFRLHEPWPDFLTYYATPATGAGWIVPKTYTEKVGSDKFKEQPVGLGPYRLVSHQAGIELVLEAYPDYWRKVPHVKRLVFKSVPEATTRLAMLKKQEADVTYGLYGALAEEVRDAFLRHTGCEELGVTSGDGKFTVIEVECLGACGFATPVMINEQFIESVTPAKVPEILRGLK